MLLQVITDIEMMREGYPPAQQLVMSAFTDQVRAILSGQQGTEPCSLQLDDCSGLSCTQAEPCQWVSRTSRQRLFTEEEELRLVRTSYDIPAARLEVPRDAPGSAVDAAVARVAELLRTAKRVVCLTGAGISVESGIRPFRAPEGASSIWGDFDAAKMTVRSGMSVVD